MKTITKTATITTEKGTVVNMKVTASRGFEMVNEELFNDGWNSTVKKGQVTEKTEIILTINKVDYKGQLDILPAKLQLDKGCYATFAGKIGLSKTKYDELNSIVIAAEKEAESDQSWIDYMERKAKAEKEEAEYYRNYRKVENAMTLNGHTY